MRFAAKIQSALDEKTKPPGSLGRLERLAHDLARIQGRLQPTLNQPRVVVFAADHGISHAGVSAYPREVTAQMVANFAHGGAAVCVLARNAGAELEVIDVGVDGDTSANVNVVQDKCANGSANFLSRCALTKTELRHALGAGERAVLRAHAAGCDLLALGEMGIGNTSSAAALLSALLKLPAARTTGAGTGVSGPELRHKRAVINQALKRVSGREFTPRALLAEFGGFEIAAIVGALLKARGLRLPILIDGFIVTVAALIAVRIDPRVRANLLFAHVSAEAGHRLALQALNAEPLLDWQMRLGEGSGAALVIPLCRAAINILNEMATFASAAVSTGND
jgi:nicotinate-nucleotide--dimethylbenzimidazole phosphoribosyltransferase